MAITEVNDLKRDAFGLNRRISDAAMRRTRGQQRSPSRDAANLPNFGRGPRCLRRSDRPGSGPPPKPSPLRGPCPAVAREHVARCSFEVLDLLAQLIDDGLH